MNILTRIVDSAEELVHIAIDRHVLPNSPNANSDGTRQRDDEDNSYNPRPRHRHRREQTSPIPCCKCTRYGICSLKRPNKGCPCVVARRPCTSGCSAGCKCQNQNSWANEPTGTATPPVAPGNTVRAPRQNAIRRARGIHC